MAGGGGVTPDQEIAVVSNQPTLLQKGVKESNGMTYKGEGGSWHVYGIPEKASFISLSGGKDSIPGLMLDYRFRVVRSILIQS